MLKFNYITSMIFNWHSITIKEVFEKVKSNENGLSTEEVLKRQKHFGFNKLLEEKPPAQTTIFLRQFQSPLIYILVIASVIALILKDYTDSIIIFSAVLLNTIIGFFQENKSSKILAELKKIIKVKAYILRDGNEKEVDQLELVPGDIIFLHPGEKVPADGRLIEVNNLKINESSLTGEWFPSEKTTDILNEKTILADRDNMVFMGCVVEDGRGKAVVVETGHKTAIGEIAQAINISKEEKTPYQKKIVHLSKIIGILVSFVSFLLFVFGTILGQNIFEMFLTAVAVAVAAIPEGLPVATTVILALGMQRILKKNGLVRKMIAAETLGSTSIICTDKTGTLTEAKMQISGIYVFSQTQKVGLKEVFFDDKKFSEKIDTRSAELHVLALKIGAICTEAFIENPDDELSQRIIRGRPMEKVLLLAALQAGFSKKELEEKQPKLDEIFFDPVYKYSAVLRYFTHQENIVYILGAPEVIIKMSKISAKRLSELNHKLEDLAGRGLRVLACAYKKTKNQKIQDKNLGNMEFVGLITFHDPIRKETKEAIKVCQKAGMKPIIVTGDHRLTAKAVAEELGLPINEENIIEGQELEQLGDEEFKKRFKKIDVYARLEPQQKLKIIKAWQEEGKVVAMTGDGVNDALALKNADIGVALGSGTDVAKESSDLILLRDNFSVIVAAVEEGRVIIDNFRKTITLLVSQCFSEIILIGTSIVLGLPLPILPAQILWENLIEGSPQGLAFAFEPKEKDVMERKPENSKAPLLSQQMKVIIFGFGIITDFILLGLFFWLFKTGLSLIEVRTIIFAALSLDTLFYSFSCKNLNKNIWQYNIFSNKYLIISVVFSLTMLLTAVYLPIFQNLLKTTALNLFDWSILLGLGFINFVLIEVVKYIFIKKRI